MKTNESVENSIQGNFVYKVNGSCPKLFYNNWTLWSIAF